MSGAPAAAHFSRPSRWPACRPTARAADACFRFQILLQNHAPLDLTTLPLGPLEPLTYTLPSQNPTSEIPWDTLKVIAGWGAGLLAIVMIVNMVLGFLASRRELANAPPQPTAAPFSTPSVTPVTPGASSPAPSSSPSSGNASVPAPVPATSQGGAARIPDAAQIVNAAETLASDLIVIGTHGRSGFERLMLGSVTEKVLRKSACPVLSVPRHSTDAAPAPPVFTRILCAVDFSECPIYALEYAMSLAQEAGGRLTVLHVIDVGPEIPDIHGLMMGDVPDVREFIAQVDERARARLKELVPDSVGTSCDVDTMVVTGRSYREVLRVAGGHASDRSYWASTAAARLTGCSTGQRRSRWSEGPPARCSRCGSSPALLSVECSVRTRSPRCIPTPQPRLSHRPRYGAGDV